MIERDIKKELATTAGIVHRLRSDTVDMNQSFENMFKILKTVRCRPTEPYCQTVGNHLRKQIGILRTAYSRQIRK